VHRRVVARYLVRNDRPGYGSKVVCDTGPGLRGRIP